MQTLTDKLKDDLTAFVEARTKHENKSVKDVIQSLGFTPLKKDQLKLGSRRFRTVIDMTSSSGDIRVACSLIDSPNKQTSIQHQQTL